MPQLIERKPIEVSKIKPHPLNPGKSRINKAVIDERADSLRDYGLQSPIKVTVTTVGGKFRGYRLVFGEIRWRAAKKLNWKSIDADIISATDAEILQIMNVENAARVDLDAISKGEAIERLCAPTTKGGAGMTRAAAGAIYGVSDSEASNLARLTALPEPWATRVKTGEMPPTFARLLLPYVEYPTVMEAINAQYVKDQKSRYSIEHWSNRDRMERALHMVLQGCTRPCNSKQTHQTNTRGLWGHYKVLFDWSAAEDKLETAELPMLSGEYNGKRAKYLRALNCKLWDKLQIEAIKAKADSKSSGKSKSATKVAKSTKPLTARELAEKKKAQAKATEDKVKRWKSRWFRYAIETAINAAPRHELLAIFSAVAYAGFLPSKTDYVGKTWQVLDNVLADAAEHEVDDNWPTELRETANHLEAIREDLAKLFWPTEDGSRQPCQGPPVPAHTNPFGIDNHNTLSAIGKFLGVDLADTWRCEQLARPDAEENQANLFLEYLNLHTKDQLEELASKWKVTLSGGKRSEMIDDFDAATADGKFPLPAELKFSS